MSESNETNGKASKGPSLLMRLDAEFQRNGGKLPDKKTIKGLTDAIKAAEKGREAAEAALVAAKKTEHDAVANLIRSVGKGRVKIDGRIRVPMGRDEVIFLREEGGGEVRDLG